LILFPHITALLHAQDSARIAAAIALAVLLGWIYKKIPDDLIARASRTRVVSKMFRFFRGDKGIVSLDDQLDATKVGHKATLSQLKRWGYPVPMGWVLPAGDDPEPLIKFLQNSDLARWWYALQLWGRLRSKLPAGQYETILNVYTREALPSDRAVSGFLTTQVLYNTGATRGRRDGGADSKQVRGVFRVAFSRDPINQHDNAVVSVAGDATQIVSGRVTPEQYRVLRAQFISSKQPSWVLPEGLELKSTQRGDIPPALIRVAFLARHLESQYGWDIEWSYDGSALWLLQSRPITTLLPIWTRKIAAEVIPGLIRPLTGRLIAP